MKSFAAAAALISLIPTILGMTINTPTNVVQCQPIQLTWADGTPPYFLSIIPGGQPMAAAIKTFPTTSATSLTWNVDLVANTIITLSLKDNTGAQAYSDIVTVQNSSDSSCVNGTVSASGVPGSTGAAPAPTTAGSSTAAASSASGSATKASSSGTGKPTGSAAAASASNAASRSTAGAFGLAGLMGLVGAALL